MSIKKIHVVHHSHTDIGYTQVQEKISRYHVDFILQAVSIIRNDIELYGKSDFKWTCENFWQIENFQKNVSSDQFEIFLECVKSGNIEITRNYLNMTDLADKPLLDSLLKRSKDFCDHNNINSISAMSADINGYPWGFADVLADNGVKNLVSCIHTHHGYQPFGPIPKIFNWISPNGKSVLVYKGEHYFTGNELGLVPNAACSYHMVDNFKLETMKASEQAINIMFDRVNSYVDYINASDYQHENIVVMASGITTDNGAPSPLVLKNIEIFNKQSDIQIVLSTVDDFFNAIDSENKKIEDYSGDFTDWWADGVGSTPTATKVCRTAQEKYNKIINLGIIDDKITSLEDYLALYCEHTWGYWSSIAEPWNTLVSALDQRKQSYAVQADTIANQILNKYYASLGEKSISFNRTTKYRVVNDYDYKYTKSANLIIEGWQTVNGLKPDIDQIEIINSETKEKYPFNVMQTGRGLEFIIVLELEARQSVDVEIMHNGEAKPFYMTNVADRTNDIDNLPYKNDFYKFEVINNSVVITDSSGKVLGLNENGVDVFAGVYEQTIANAEEQMEIRRKMGRNRKSPETKRYFSMLKNYKYKKDTVFDTFIAEYDLEGCSIFEVEYRSYNNFKRLEVTVKVGKSLSWSPENLYIGLPSNFNPNQTIKLHKSGCLFDPCKDVLPNLNSEFYLLQSGYLISETDETYISIVDAPLVTLKHLDDLSINEDKTKLDNGRSVKSWVMNNFWETNFRADLSGFYEFKYQVDTPTITQLDYLKNIAGEFTVLYID